MVYHWNLQTFKSCGHIWSSDTACCAHSQKGCHKMIAAGGRVSHKMADIIYPSVTVKTLVLRWQLLLKQCLFVFLKTFAQPIKFPAADQKPCWAKVPSIYTHFLKNTWHVPGKVLVHTKSFLFIKQCRKAVWRKLQKGR